MFSPDLFSLYREIVLRHIGGEDGIKIEGHNVNYLRYVDDTVLLADSEEKLQNLIQIVHRKSMIYGMELKAKKTETMVVTKKQETNIPTCNLIVNGLSLRQVNKFKCLGTMINWDIRDEIDLNIRTAQAKASFLQMKIVLCYKNIFFKTRYRVLKCYIYPIFHYNCKSWNISKRMAIKINSFEMWCFRTTS